LARAEKGGHEGIQALKVFYILERLEIDEICMQEGRGSKMRQVLDRITA
jgi:hypothetical protein